MSFLGQGIDPGGANSKIYSGLSGSAGNMIGSGFNSIADALIGPTYNAQGAKLEQAVSGEQAQAGMAQQQAFIQALAGQNGIQNQSDVYNQYQALAQGQGPSVAQNMLNQQTGQNVASQAALMAGQRGAAANPALLARQAAMQGANIQQQAVGQGATMRSNEQLNALNQMGNISGQQVSNTGGAIQNYNSNALGAVANLNNARVSQQNAINAANASSANAAMQQRGQLVGSITSAIGGAAGLSDKNEKTNIGDAKAEDFLNALKPHSYEYKDPANGEGQHMGVMAQDLEKSELGKSMVKETEAGKMVDYGKSFGALTAALADMHARLKELEGSGGKEEKKEAPPKKMAAGGEVKGPKSKAAQYFMSFAEGGEAPEILPIAPTPAIATNENQEKKGSGGGGADIGKAAASMAAAHGAEVPGKAKMKGDNLKNDTVHALLSPGEIVIPRSIAQSDDAANKAAAFVAAIIAKKHGKRKE